VASAVRRKTRLLAVLICACAPAGSAAAQTSSWEIEGYGGIVAARTASEGSRTLPAAGAPLVTSNPIFPSRQTSSWFFGDGATLLNGVNEQFTRPGRIAPLDSAFGPLASARVPAFGARVRRRLNTRYSLELGVDAFVGSSIKSDALPAIVEAARTSFTQAFSELLGTGPFAGVSVAATASTVSSRRRDTAFTAAINAAFGSWGSLVPYATFGAGIVTGSGSLPSATIEGRYRFSILNEVPIDETDRVSFRYARGAAFVGVLGGGLRRDISTKWGLRIDARVLVGPDSTRIRLDAQPSSVRGVPAGFVESFTNPAIQFSNDLSTGRRSTLSGAALQNADVFSGGVQARTVVTVGVVRRF
jgi:hypothetical protein